MVFGGKYVQFKVECWWLLHCTSQVSGNIQISVLGQVGTAANVRAKYRYINKQFI